MKIYVVHYSSIDGGWYIHSAHYSEWMAKITVENKQKKDREIASWDYQEVDLTSEGD